MTNIQRKYFTISNVPTIGNVVGDFANSWYTFRFPQEFYNSNNIKGRSIRIISFTYIKGTETTVGGTTTISYNTDIGITLHSDFNQETNEIDRFMALSNYGAANEKMFSMPYPQDECHVWFRNWDGSTLFPTTTADVFYIQMELYY